MMCCLGAFLHFVEKNECSARRYFDAGVYGEIGEKIVRVKIALNRFAISMLRMKSVRSTLPYS